MDGIKCVYRIAGDSTLDDVWTVIYWSGNAKVYKANNVPDTVKEFIIEECDKCAYPTDSEVIVYRNMDLV